MNFLVSNCQKNYQSQTPLLLKLTCDWQIDATWHRLSSLLNKMFPKPRNIIQGLNIS